MSKITRTLGTKVVHNCCYMHAFTKDAYQSVISTTLKRKRFRHLSTGVVHKLHMHVVSRSGFYTCNLFFFFRCHITTLCIACSKAARTVTLTFLSKNDYTVHVLNPTFIFKLVYGFTYIANVNWSCINFTFFFRSFRDCKKSYHLHWKIMLDKVCNCILSSYQK